MPIMLPGGSGGAGIGGASVREDLFFTNVSTRDSWTTPQINDLPQGIVCAVANETDYDYYQWNAVDQQWFDANLIFQGRRGVQGLTGNDGQDGQDGKSVTGGEFTNDNLVFTLSDNSTISIPGEPLKAPRINSASIVGNDIVFVDSSGAEIRIINGKNNITGPRGLTGNSGTNGTDGTDGSDGISVVDGSIVGTNLVFTRSTGASPITIPIEPLRGASVTSVEFIGDDMKFNYSNGTSSLLVNGRLSITGPRGQSFIVQFSNTANGPWSATYVDNEVTGSRYWRHSLDMGDTWSAPAPYRQLASTNIENPLTLSLGNLTLASSGDILASYNSDRQLSAYPIANYLNDSGEFTRAQEVVPSGVETEVVFGTNPLSSSVPMDYYFTPPNESILMGLDVFPMEDYSGKIYLDLYNSSGSLIARHVSIVSVSTNQPVALTIEPGPKFFVRNTQQYRFQLINADTTLPLLVKEAETPILNPNEPYRVARFIPVNRVQVLNTDDGVEVADMINSLDSAYGIQATKIIGLAAAVQNSVGSPRGNINFSGDLSQFNPASKGDYWVAAISSDSQSFGGLTFNNGDRLVALTTISENPSTLNSADWLVEPNVIPQASNSTVGGVKIPPSGSLEMNPTTSELTVKEASDTVKGAVTINTPGGVPTLNASTGKLSPDILPPLSGTITTQVDELNDLLNFSVSEKAYSVYVESTSEEWFLPSNGDPTNINNWFNRGVATTSVVSFNTRKGDVVPLAGDYDADKITETTDRKFLSPEQKTKLDSFNGVARVLPFNTEINYKIGDEMTYNGEHYRAKSDTVANATPTLTDWGKLSYSVITVNGNRLLGKDTVHTDYIVQNTTTPITLTLNTFNPSTYHKYTIYVKDVSETKAVNLAPGSGVTVGFGLPADGIFSIHIPVKIDVVFVGTTMTISIIEDIA